jgi:hypothetical protein
MSEKPSDEDMHKELQWWDERMGDSDYDQGYVLGFRMALKYALGIKPPPEVAKR